jgi:hypothetical protein
MPVNATEGHRSEFYGIDARSDTNAAWPSSDLAHEM